MQVISPKTKKINGAMKLVCECYGPPPPEITKLRNTKSKKCNCPFSFRVYCFDTPTNLVRCKLRDSLEQSEEVLSFENGVYIYEYPLEDHTCGCGTIIAIRKTFENNNALFNAQSMQSDNIVIEKCEILSEEKFWGYAQVLYNTDVPQDKAFSILQDLGNDNIIIRSSSLRNKMHSIM